MQYRQGEVWQIQFGKDLERPGIIISRDELNRGRLLLAIPCTASQVEQRARHENNVFLPAGAGGLDEDSVAQVHLVQPVEREFFIRYRGRLEDEQLSQVLQALVWAIDFLVT